MSKIYFVSGIDTDAGKTYVCGWLARKWMDEGYKVATVKFVQTGNEGFSEDIRKHREIMGVELPEDKDLVTSPLIYKYPASAQLAARLDGKEIDITKVDDSLRLLDGKYDIILIEGAGGLMVPLRDDFLTIDYPESREIPIILVTNGVLGSINHTILSLEAIKSRKMTLYALAYNHHFDKDKIISEDTQAFLKRYLKANFPDALWIDVPSV